MEHKIISQPQIYEIITSINFLPHKIANDDPNPITYYFKSNQSLQISYSYVVIPTLHKHITFNSNRSQRQNQQIMPFSVISSRRKGESNNLQTKGTSGNEINMEEKQLEMPTDQRVIGILFQLAKKAEQGQFKDINYQFVRATFSKHKQQLLRILANQRKILHVVIFFIIKYLTNKPKLESHIAVAINSFLFAIIDLFLTLLQLSNAAKSTFSQVHKLPFQERSLCIQVLLLLTQRLYVDDININDDLGSFTIGQGFKVAQILIHEVEKEKQFEIVRKMLSVMSNMIVFSEVRKRPVNFHEFCLSTTLQIQQAPISTFDKPISEFINRYFQGIKFFLKLDPLYHSQLFLNLKKWIILNVQSEYSFKHFEVMIDFIEQKLFPLMQNQLFIILIQSQNSQNSQLVNKIIKRLLNPNRQQLNKQIQKYLIILAEHGNSETKKQVTTYLYNFLLNKNEQLLSDSINFILKIYLSQELPLQGVQNVLPKYSHELSSENIKRLHQEVNKKKDNIHLTFLSNYCHKKGEFAVTNLSSLSELLVQDEWLECLGGVHQPYLYYFNVVGRLLFGRNFIVSKQNIDKNPLINNDFTQYCCKIYEILIKSVAQRLGYQQSILKQLFFFSSTLHQYSKINNITLLERYISKMTSFSSDIFEFLLSSVNFSRNFVSIKLLLQILIQYSEHYHTSTEKDNQISKIICFISQTTNTSQYFRLSTYNLESVALLYQLSLRHTFLIENSYFLGLFQHWSSIMTHQEIKSFCYFFIFREIKSICPFLNQREMEQPLSRLRMLWIIIFHLLDRRRQPCSYLHMSSNKIICEFIDPKKCKKGLKIEGTILKNCNLEMSWHIHIETFKQIYTISIKGCSIKIDQKDLISNPLQKSDKKPLKDYIIRQISKLGESFKFKLQLQSSQKIQIKFYLNDFSILFDKLPYLTLQGDIKRIKICGKNDFILKQINFIDKYSPGSLQKIQQHIHILNKWNIKTLSLNFIQSIDFIDKFDFQHAFSYFAEMIKSFSHMSLPITYGFFINLALKMFGFNRKQSLQKRPTIMIEIFNKLAERFHEVKGKSRQLKPQIQIKYVKEYPRQFYFLATSALLPKIFWNNFSEKTKDLVKAIILQLIEDNKIRLLQNNSLDFFQKCLQIGKQKSQFLQICNKIITTHCLNNILKYKFKRYIFLAKQQKTIQNGFKFFITSLIRYLIVENESYIDLRQLAKYLILNKDYIQIFFPYCQTSDKITIIHYLSENQVKDMKFKKMKIMNSLIDKKMNPQEQSEFLIWLIIQSKQLLMKISRKMIAFKDALEKVTLVNFYVELMLKFRNYGLQQEKVNLNQLIYEGLKIMINEINTDDKLYKIGIGFNINIYINSFFQIWEEKNQLQKIQASQKKKNILQKMQKEITDLITQKFDKKSFLIFMKKLRIICCSKPQFLLFILTNQKFKRLSIAYLSIFLQFLFQILIKIQNKDIFTTLQRDELIEIIFNLFKQLIMVKDKSMMEKYIYYSYPFITCNKNYYTENAVDKLFKMQKIEKKELLELNGGIYFKSLLILSKMMKIRPYKDYTTLVQIFLFGPEGTTAPQRPKLLNRTNSDGNQVPFQRTPIQKYLSDTIQNHKYYYFKDDLQMIAQTSTISLNPYLCDYLLLFLSEYLCQNASEIDKRLLKKYNELFVKGCLIPSVWQDLIKVQISDTASTKTNPISEQNIIFDDRKKQVRFQSPYKRYQQQNIDRQQSLKFQFGSFNQGFGFFNSNSPRKTFTKKKHSLEDIPLISPKKLEVFQLVKKDHTAWYKFQTTKNIPSYFCPQAKQIKFKQKLHTHYVLKGEKSTSEISVHEKSILLRFQQEYSFILNQQKTNPNDTTAYLEQKSRKVKKIFPYTCKKPPVNRVVQNTLPNMTCPATCKMVVQDYEAGCWTSQHSINMNLYGRDDIKQSEYEPSNIHQLRQLTQDVESDQQQRKSSEISAQPKMESDEMSLREKKYCQLILKEGAYFCEYSLDSDGLKLQTRSNRPNNEELWYLKLGTPTQNLLKTDNLQFIIFPTQVNEVFFRRFNQIMYNSIELFFKNGTSRYISFYKKEYLLSFIRKFQKIFSKVKMIKDPIKQFEDAKYTEKWVQGFMTNFDYLMLLNKFSGRNYNDVNQYYTFPWILKDYNSQRIDLTNPDIFRDLSKPIGALNPQKIKKLKEKYKIDTSSQRCLYGSHYSTSLFIFYYLIRLQPFSSLHRNLQKGDWDIADRLFNSISQVWESLICESTSSDIKQCIPQFYYMPSFLKNTARIQFGQKQCGESVSDVELPKWAKDPQQFIITMRAALESDYVSQHLHEWIDLIFGKHQNSLQKNNSFHPYSYTQSQILSQLHNKGNQQMVQGIICQITYFGQCPIQLFKKQHKQKNTISQSRVKKRASSEMLSTKSGGSALYQQCAITPGRKITRLDCDLQHFYIEIQSYARDRKWISLHITANLQQIRQELQKMVLVRKQHKPVSQMHIYSSKHEIRIHGEIILDLCVKFDYKQVRFNEVWIACFGNKGLKIYNWQLQERWCWLNEEVNDVYIQPTRVIFSTPSGKLCFYSFFDRKFHEYFVFKDTCDMKIKVAMLPKLPSQYDRNVTHYKILCVGDLNKLVIVSYAFQQTTNFTSINA